MSWDEEGGGKYIVLACEDRRRGSASVVVVAQSVISLRRTDTDLQCTIDRSRPGGQGAAAYDDSGQVVHTHADTVRC